MKYVCKPHILKQGERTFRKRVVRRSHSRVREKRREENGRERRMQASRNKGRKLHANIVPKRGMMKATVGNYIPN